MKLFLSSTYTDLIPERAAAERVIVAMGQQFVGMEHFFAREETVPQTACQHSAADFSSTNFHESTRK